MVSRRKKSETFATQRSPRGRDRINPHSKGGKKTNRPNTIGKRRNFNAGPDDMSKEGRDTWHAGAGARDFE